MLAFFPCLDISSIAPLVSSLLAVYVWQGWVSLRRIEPAHVRFHCPLEPGTLRARSFGWQGRGLYIFGTATLTNTNVYSNQASTVCSPSALA